jgi:hypothetical protein
MNVCKASGCNAKVWKDEHSLCYKCWKKNNTKQGYVKGKGDVWLTSTKLGKIFNVNSRKMNLILDELGWIYKPRHKKGWLPTKHGKDQGGRTQRIGRSGVPYVIWPDSIPENKILIRTFAEHTGTQSSTPQSSTAESAEYNDFRKKYPANYRCTDGHYVRSKAEMLIDNWLYTNGVVHAYERRLPIKEAIYCDFYIRKGKVYIEFWGMEGDEKYARRMQQKREAYAKSDFDLIELNNSDIKNLDDVLPMKLLKYNISVD